MCCAATCRGAEALVDRLNDMYAFAIWDSRTRKLVMIRDRMGIMPVYFYRTADGDPSAL